MIIKKTIYGVRNNYLVLNEKSKAKAKQSCVQKIIEIREKYADILASLAESGLEIPKDEPSEKEYDKKIRTLWEEV